MNTYGLRSINTSTFNISPNTAYTYPQNLRNIVVTFLKVHNLTLNILGYIPGVSLFSGCTRIGIGIVICILTLAIGERNATKGAIIGRWYDEALLTGVTQIARGALEAFIPSHRIYNACLDATATVINLSKELFGSLACWECMYGRGSLKPYPDPEYPFPLWILHLA